MNEQQLLQLKRQIDEAKQSLSELKGQQKQLMKQLQTDFGCDTIKQAEQKIDQKRKEKSDFQIKFDKNAEQISEKYEI